MSKLLLLILLGNVYLNIRQKNIINEIEKENFRIICEVNGLRKIQRTNTKIEQILSLKTRISALEKYCSNPEDYELWNDDIRRGGK